MLRRLRWRKTTPQAEVEEADDTDEIIVTATLRNENLQDVPIAVTAFSGESLEKAGVRDVKSFETVAASFNTNSTQTEIRRHHTARARRWHDRATIPALKSAVGIFLDGVYLSRPGVALGDLLDVQQIELLRGPQGTLFGRNTSAGAVSIKTAKPNLNGFEGFANATYGNYDLFNVQAGVSMPLANNTAGIRLSGAYRKRDGFVRNAVGDDSYNRNRHVVRGQFYYEPSSDLDIRIIADYSKYDEKCCDAIIVRDTSFVANGCLCAWQAFPPMAARRSPAIRRSGIIAAVTTLALRDATKQWGLSGEINYSFGNAKLTAITSFRDFKAASQQETDFVGLLVYSTSDQTSASTPTSARSKTDIKTFTQEIRLAGSALDDKIDYLVGGYYSNEKIDEIQSLTLGADHQAYISATLLSAVPAATAQFLVTAFGPNLARNMFAGGVSSARQSGREQLQTDGTQLVDLHQQYVPRQ